MGEKKKFKSDQICPTFCMDKFLPSAQILTVQVYCLSVESVIHLLQGVTQKL